MAKAVPANPLQAREYEHEVALGLETASTSGLLQEALTSGVETVVARLEAAMFRASERSSCSGRRLATSVRETAYEHYRAAERDHEELIEAVTASEARLRLEKRLFVRVEALVARRLSDRPDDAGPRPLQSPDAERRRVA